MRNELLRMLPKVDEILSEEVIKIKIDEANRIVVVDSIRETIEDMRQAILKDEVDKVDRSHIVQEILKRIDKNSRMKLNKVINATGVVIHTNLGRSALCKEAVENVVSLAEGYSNLEYDLENGKRGSRYSHIEELVTRITGAEAAVVVNNNAAAVMLVLNTLCQDKEAIVSRGQLVEIGGSFRIPDVMRFSGAKLVEVGTTNRTHLYDYENAIKENTGVLLKVHTSNFKVMGFTEEVETKELVNLACANDIPVVEDIGSGTLIDFSKYGFSYEPTVQESIKNGIDVVTFSGDKMLGGPQAGIIVGKKLYIDKIKKNQLTRALRIDKLTLGALEATLKHYLDEKAAIENIPTLNMMLSSKEIQKERAYKLKRKLAKAPKHFEFKVAEDFSMVGGGSMPTEKIPTYVVKIKSEKYKPDQLEKLLRLGQLPIVGRISSDALLMDVRTIFDEEFACIFEALNKIN